MGRNTLGEKKKNVLSKIVIPRLFASIRYILTELEENEREETFRLKRVKQNKIKTLEGIEEVGAGEKTQLVDKESEIKVKQSAGKTTEENVVPAPPAAEGGDPLVVINPSEAGETGDVYKSTQQLQTLKPENEKEVLQDVEKVNLQAVIEETSKLKEKNKTFLPVHDTKPIESLVSESKATLDDTKALREGDDEDKTIDETSSSSELLTHSNTETTESSVPKLSNVMLNDNVEETLDQTIESQKSTKSATDEKEKEFSSKSSKESEVSESLVEEEISTSFKVEEISEKSQPSVDKITLSTEQPNDTYLETSNFPELSSNREREDNKSGLKVKPPISDVSNINADKSVSDENLKRSSDYDRTASSQESKAIPQLETTKLIEDTVLPDSYENLKQDKTNLTLVDDSVLPRQKSITSPTEESKTETTKSKSSVRIKMPETTSDEIVDDPQRKDLIDIDTASENEELPSTTAVEAKEIVELQEKNTEGSVEKLGEGDNQMYTRQDQNQIDKTRLENDFSVTGIVDAEPYFEVATASKELLENVNLPEGLKEAILQDVEPTISRATTSEDTQYDYDEADIELDETDVDIGTSRTQRFSQSNEPDKSKEVEKADPTERRDDPNANNKDKPSKSSENKRHRT